MSPDEIQSALERLAQFVATLEFGDLPASVIERTQLVLLDSIGAILAGSRAPEIAHLAAHARQSSKSHRATLMGLDGGADAGWAGLVNATAGTSTELDEGHAAARGHPAIHVIPLALALGEERNLAGRDVLTAIVAGYEVAARVGAGAQLKNAVHPHGTWGTLGAAAAAARLRGEGSAVVLESVRIASSLMLATSFQTAYEGALVRNVYAGMSNRNGLLAAELAACGFTGEQTGPATVLGTVLSDSFRPQAMDDALGTRFEIMRGYFKIHSCCRYNHATLDALQTLQERFPFEWQDVERLRVETYDLAARLKDAHPTTTLAARFSIPYAVAIALVRGSTAPSAFDETSLTDASVRTLAERVQVVEEPDMTSLTPHKRPARVTVELRDGRVGSEMVYSSRGDPDRPFSHEELVYKYMKLAKPVIGADKAQAALEATQKFSKLSSVHELTAHLRPGG